jgi:hypothetical protein
MFRPFSPIIRSVTPWVAVYGFPSFLIGCGPGGCCVSRVHCTDVTVRLTSTETSAECTRPTQQPSGPPPINKTEKTVRCYSRSNAPDDGRKRPKHVELKEHQSTSLLHQVDITHYLKFQLFIIPHENVIKERPNIINMYVIPVRSTSIWPILNL